MRREKKLFFFFYLSHSNQVSTKLSPAATPLHSFMHEENFFLLFFCSGLHSTMVGPDSSDHIRDSSKILGRSTGANDGLELRQGPWPMSNDTWPLTQVHLCLLFDPCDDRVQSRKRFVQRILVRDKGGKGGREREVLLDW
ncbi:hypothetical protein BDV26DRAFT_273013 [Aspergillus bertholletiae]|uniref:Uncharacterized protein n=1 Tax=Aspergillus bertholletiae TaxID=1226010 RepID=A0A5N7AUH0_9EURO|nr:hypothetical protein BDV26DRAFT_273013 [Aspergillus bertholletiae]